MAPDKSKSIFDCHLHTIVGSDKLGRPVVIFKIKNIDKEVFSDIDSSRLYMLYQLRTIRSLFTPNIDKMITIYDFEGSGFNNLALGMFQTLNPELSNMFPQMSYMNLIIHPNWILKVAWGVAKNFMSEYQKKKVRVISDDDLLDDLLNYIDIDNIPTEYGGNYKES